MNVVSLKKHLPKTPGAYLMRSKDGAIIYVGKAANLKRRVLSYFERPHDYRIQKLVSEIQGVDFKKTDTVIEALILEARLIKKYQPKYNVLEKDDKSFLHVVITREKFPRVIMVREKEALSFDNPLRDFGPFTSPSALREALRMLRKIFPWSEHDFDKSRSAKPCFNYQIGLCAGTCANATTPANYRKNIYHLILLFEGEKKRLLQALRRDMKNLAKSERFEDAIKIRRKIYNLEHIQDVALIKEDIFSSQTIKRIEGYDISNISGTSSVGSMVVFTENLPDKAEYRKFKIKTISGQNDVGMLREVLSRRFSRHINNPDKEIKNGSAWPKPDLILVDGGLTQVNAARSTLKQAGLKIPVVGIAKGPERKRNDFFYPAELHDLIRQNRNTLIAVRNEAHRFAIKYHRELRAKRI